MPIAHSLRRLAVSSIAILQTRAELVAIEVEEEAVRYFSYLLLSLIAVVCIGIAFLLSIALIVAYYWDTHRLASMLALIVLFLLLAGALGWRVYSSYRRKPRLLETTLSELSRDIDTFKHF